MMTNLSRTGSQTQGDILWKNLLAKIPDAELASFISAVAKMRQNERLLTSQELDAYINWNLRCDSQPIEEFFEAMSDAKLNLLIAIEDKVQEDPTTLTPHEMDTLNHTYAHFESQIHATSPGAIFDSDFEFLLYVEEKVQQNDTALTPREMDVYQRWYLQPGIAEVETVA